jgi:hypothetical protein
MGTPYEGIECAIECACVEVFATADGFARERGFRAEERPVQVNFAVVDRVIGPAMLTSAIVFGMVGVAAGFTWDYVINRGK